MNDQQPNERKPIDSETTFSDVAGALSLPVAILAFFCLAAHVGSPVFLFGMLWVAFLFGIVGAHRATGGGRVTGQTTIVLISFGLLFLFSLPNVQTVRE